MFAFVQTARIFCLVAVCCSAAVAGIDPVWLFSTTELNAGNPVGTEIARLGRSDNFSVPQFASLTTKRAERSDASFSSTTPFDLPATASSHGEVLIRWRELQSRMSADMQALAACRVGEAECSQAAHRFLSIVELGRRHSGRARLGWINRAVNLSIKPTADWTQHGYGDLWTSPLQTLGSGAGDCEDYAIVKFAALRELGVLPEDIRLVIVRDNRRYAEHAVVAVRLEQDWLILDNRTMAILSLHNIRHYRPLFALDQKNIRTTAAPIGDHVIDR